MPTKEIDPRLEKIQKTVFTGTLENILRSLEQIKLVKAIPGNDWQLCSELTQTGFDHISDATFVALSCIFEHSRINLVSYQSFDEIKFSNLLVKQAGLPTIRSSPERNEIDIKFVGIQPLIKHINSYLDPQKVKANHVKSLEINQIALIIEPSDHLN